MTKPAANFFSRDRKETAAVVNEIAAASCDCSYPAAAQLRFGHFGHKDTVTFANYAGRCCFVFFLRRAYAFLLYLTVSSVVYIALRIKLLSINGVRRLFIGHGDNSHFAQMLYVFPRSPGARVDISP